MIKLKTLLIFIAISNILFAQKQYEGKTKWSQWELASPCFSNLKISFICNGWEKQVEKYNYNFRIKNTSNKTIHFSLDIKFLSGENYSADGRFDLAPGKEYTHVSMYYDTKPAPSYQDFFTTTITRYIENDGRDDWTVPSYSCNGLQKYCDANCDKSNSSSNNNSSNNNSSNTNSTPYDVTDLQAAIDKVNSLCGKLNLARSNAVSLSNKYCSKTWQRTDAELQEAKRAITALEKEIDDQGSAEKAAQKAADEQAERERKAAEEKNNRYQTYMSDGESALGNEKYDEALQNFQNAVNEASNDGQLNAARNAIAKAQKAKEDAARRVRVEEKEAVEKKQNDVTTAAIGGFAGVMALVKDNYSNGKFAAKFQIGLGYGNTPLIVNSAKQFKTTIKDNNQILFHMGFNLIVFNNKGINFELKPSIGIGLSSFQKGTDGGGEEYGGTGILWLAPKAKSNFKLFAEGGYFFRNGTYNYDQDVALGPTSATDNVEKGEFKYKVLRYGGGFKISFVNDEYLESYIKPAIFLEMPSFFTKTTKPTMVFNVQAYILSNALIDFSYAKNYYIPGKIDYFGSFTKENKNYFSIKIIRQGKLK